MMAIGGMLSSATRKDDTNNNNNNNNNMKQHSTNSMPYTDKIQIRINSKGIGNSIQSGNLSSSNLTNTTSTTSPSSSLGTIVPQSSHIIVPPPLSNDHHHHHQTNRANTIPKIGTNGSNVSSTTSASHTTTIVPQDTLLLSSDGNHNQHHHHHPHHNHRSSSPPSTNRMSSSNHRTSRIASCISVQSVASIASTDSSLSDYPPNTPICKFCHQRARPNDPLISPCHCKGTIRYMHCRCLMKWLDKLKKRNARNQPLACEICNYEYRWRKRFKPTSEWQLPPCIGNDRQWHTVFVICAMLMVASMVNLIIFGEEDGHSGRHHHSHNGYQTLRTSSGMNPFNNGVISSSGNGGDGKKSTLTILPSNAFDMNGTINGNNHRSRTLTIQTKQSNNGGTIKSDIQTDHFPYHTHRSHRAGRKSLPTKPSEVILVVSGCLFFITFFLGTFAQIKSEVSFYTMIVRFIHWNQQWIIEEYDPDGDGTAGTNHGTGTLEGTECVLADSNEASTSSINKDDHVNNRTIHNTNNGVPVECFPIVVVGNGGGGGGDDGLVAGAGTGGGGGGGGRDLSPTGIVSTLASAIRSENSSTMIHHVSTINGNNHSSTQPQVIDL
ncbi:hypothetical protein RDWZM_003633 [Blomia tropicalis]|uniref:RING-CH-type domain-containing protein n=1 Tax=Blomia tropicalis TaxID=40697 RepID=A0A9Q0MHA2_BLOTA|nr:hypothetical protein RDWZM_003633 [Blomia tropicalis]